MRLSWKQSTVVTVCNVLRFSLQGNCINEVWLGGRKIAQLNQNQDWTTRQARWRGYQPVTLMLCMSEVSTLFIRQC